MNIIKILYINIILCFVLTACSRKDGIGGSSSPDTVVITKPKPIDSQNLHTRNLVIVTLDGFRWQEVFRGADSTLLYGGKYTTESKESLTQKFWAGTSKERREKLLPFFWNYLVENGQLYGNRDIGNDVNVKNKIWLSYPGYNEIFTGYPDPNITSNSFGVNPNHNVLEFINKQKGFEGKVAAFCVWNKFPDIFNIDRSGFYLVAGTDINHQFYDPSVLPVIQHLATLPRYKIMDADSAADKQAFAVAKAYMMKNKPRVLYISFHNTDGFGHAGKYDCYLEAAHNNDILIEDLWNYLQSDDFYKGKTTLFLATDHGRGIGDDWKEHSLNHPFSDEIWFGVIGPDTKPSGEIKTKEQLYQYQYTKSLAAFLGLNYTNEHPIGDRITSIMESE